MAIPKKGSRPITVDGQDYRWFVRRKPTHCTGSGWTPLTVAVSSDVPRSASMLVTLATNRPDAWLHPGSIAITPADVAELIRLAIRRGWDPAKPGSAFRIDVGGESPLLEPPCAQPPNQRGDVFADNQKDWKTGADHQQGEHRR
jgi:hypothetical protein